MVHAPDSQTVSQILAKINAMLTQLSSESARTARIAPIKNTLASLTVKQAGQTVEDLPMKDGAINTAEWGIKSEADRQRIGKVLIEIHDELRWLNNDSIISGKQYFAVFSVLLLLVAVAYVGSHLQSLRKHIQPPLQTGRIVAVLDQARFIELKLASLKEKQNRKLSEKVATVSPADERLAQPPKSESKTSQATAPTPTQTSSLEQDQAAIQGKWTLFNQALYEIPLTYETVRLLGTASAEIETNDISIHITYQQFLKHLQADLESLSTSYFWTSHPWRWAELSLWGTMGCLVGLLFYIAGLLGQGIFHREESTMFWAELFIAPIVVPVVFFLFTMSGITEFSPSQSSITMNIGVAFIFGFAIRRTIGLLDIIKKRFFPDPSPGSANPGN